jgi:hypothetical protein
VKDLVILGSHPRTRTDVDFDNPNIDIWAFNEVLVHPGFCKRADAIFQMHPKAIWNNPLNMYDKDNANWLKTQTQAIVYMVEYYPEVPKCVAYPFKEIRDALLPNFTVASEKGRKDYFGSSVAYSTALGIYLGYKKIDWYGIELEQESEYLFQAPSAAFWAGIAIGRGIDFTAHSHLFDRPLYGIESFITIDKKCFQDNIDRLKPKVEEALTNYNDLKAKFQDLYKRFEDSNSVKEEVEKTAVELSKCAQEHGFVEGAKQENERYLHRAAAMEEASGSYVFSRHQFETDSNAIIKAREQAILEWSHSGGVCRSLLEQVGEKFDSHRRKTLKDLREAVDEYIKLSNKVGMFSGGAQEDRHLRELIPMS